MTNITHRLVFKATKFFQELLLTKRADNPYATHVPILVALSQLLNVRHVLEMGCGQYSTLTFLDTSIFPELVSLHSIENDHAWAEKITTLVNGDPRFRLSYVEDDIWVSINEAVVNQKISFLLMIQALSLNEQQPLAQSAILQ